MSPQLARTPPQDFIFFFRSPSSTIYAHFREAGHVG